MKDHVFETVVVGCVAGLGLLGVVGGVLITLFTNEIVAGTATIGLGTTALGTLGGVLVSPALKKTEDKKGETKNV